jgi:adenosylhomocysteine nucleosidase
MNFVVALKAEAGPLIEFFKLSKQSSEELPLFTNDNHRLVLSGPGKELSAKATAFLRNRFPLPNQAWLNFGLAGHGSLPVGKIFLANRILDKQERAFYPTQCLKHKLESSALRTCSFPLSGYPEAIGFDMEASAFCKTASPFSIRELIQVIKVVSDNPDYPVDTFDRSSAGALIEKSLPSLLPVVDQLETIAKKIELPMGLKEHIDSVFSLHPFSETQCHQIRKLLTHAHALGASKKDTLQLVMEATSEKQAISNLSNSLENHRILQ